MLKSAKARTYLVTLLSVTLSLYDQENPDSAGTTITKIFLQGLFEHLANNIIDAPVKPLYEVQPERLLRKLPVRTK